VGGGQRQRRDFHTRRAKLVMTERIKGGLRGFLHALDALLDPDKPEPERHEFRPSQHGSDKRARALAQHRRERASSKRSPF